MQDPGAEFRRCHRFHGRPGSLSEIADSRLSMNRLVVSQIWLVSRRLMNWYLRQFCFKFPRNVSYCHLAEKRWCLEFRQNKLEY